MTVRDTQMVRDQKKFENHWFTLINYCAIVFSFALMFVNGWLTACDGFYDASACWLSHMKQ